jgi:glycosyltransferase involved in cell wall biosynthesis
VKPLRVVLVTRRFWPCAASAERAMALLAVGLAQRGCRVTVLTARCNLRWPPAIQFRGLPVVRLAPPPAGRWNTWRYMRCVEHWLREHRCEIDLAYVAGLKEEACAAVQALGGRRRVVLAPQQAGHAGDCIWQLEAPGGERIKAACLRADAFVAPTPAIERELQAAGYPHPRIHHLPLGVPLDPPRTPATRAAARALLAEAHAALQLGEQTPLVVSTGRLAPERGWEQLVAAWSALAGRWPEARLWLAGEVPQPAAVRQTLETPHAAGRVAAIGVFDELDSLLAAADALVAPDPEGAPLPLLEAMAAQLPSVAADVPANRWLLTDGQEGLLVPPGDGPALVAALARLLEQPELAARLGSAARGRVARDFPLARMIDAHLTCFDGLK